MKIARMLDRTAWHYYSGLPYKSLSIGSVIRRNDGSVVWKFDLHTPRRWKTHGEVNSVKAGQAAIRRLWLRWKVWADLTEQ